MRCNQKKFSYLIAFMLLLASEILVMPAAQELIDQQTNTLENCHIHTETQSSERCSGSALSANSLPSLLPSSALIYIAHVPPQFINAQYYERLERPPKA